MNYVGRISSTQLINNFLVNHFFKIVGLIALAVFFIYTPEAMADNFIQKLPKEVQNTGSKGLLATILDLIITGVAIICGAGLIAIPVMVIMNVISILREIRDGRKTYGDLFSVILFGVIAELIMISVVYFTWDYLEAALAYVS